MSQATPDPQQRLDDPEQRALRAVVGSMVPASTELGLPGADDDTIFADILTAVQGSSGGVREALRRLDEVAGAAFSTLDPPAQAAAATRLQERWPEHYMQLVSVTARCYYRDDRVMRSLGMEPRPPFPKGFEVQQGDWSLLDPVRARGKIYRDAP